MNPSLKQIQKMFFPNSSYQAAQRRLRFLEYHGYLSSTRHFYTSELVYYFNKQTSEFLQSQGLIQEIITRFHVDLKGLEVDVKIGDVIIALKSVAAIQNLKSKNQTKKKGTTDYYFTPILDITFSIERESHLYNFVVDIELFQKMKMNYHSRFSHYYFKPDIDAVLVLTKDEALIKHILRFEKEISESKPDKKVYFATLGTFLSNPLECMFVNSEGGKFVLKRMIQNNNIHREISEGVTTASENQCAVTR